MLKSDKTGDLKPRLSLNIKCRDCIHFKRGPAFFEKKCKDLGILPEARACQAFTPDIYKLSRVEADTIFNLGKLVKDFKETHFRILSFIFRNMSLIKRSKLKFGQPVYINLSSPYIDYLDAYYKGYVLGVSKSGDQIFITSSLRKTTDNVYLSVLPSSILTLAQFKKRRKKLKKFGRVKIPKKYITANLEEKPPIYRKPITDEVPTIDNIPPEWFSPSSLKKGDDRWHVKSKKMNKNIRKGRTKVFNISKGKK